MEVAGYVELTLQYEREGGKWVGTCLELGTSTYGNSLDRVRKDLETLVPEHLNLLEEAGERERFFEEHGIQFHHVIPEPREVQLPTISVDLLLKELAPIFQPRIFPVEEASKELATV